MWATEKRSLYFGAQLWACRICGTIRQWGEEAPPEMCLHEFRQLRCLACKQVRPHFYGGVKRTWE